MNDPVTLYVYEPFVPLSADGSGSDARYRNATPAEVLAHPAVAALTADLADLRYDYGLHVKALDDIRAMCETAGIPGETWEPDPSDHEDPSPVRTWHSTPRVVERLVKTLTAERDRLQAVLAAERGERGPEGWHFAGRDFWQRDSVGEPTYAVSARRNWKTPIVWHWSVCTNDDAEALVASGEAPTALEAMEAADRAGEGRKG